MNDWDDLLPKWRREGRTGPGAIAPKYKSAKDRRTVRNGGAPGMGTNSNPGGPGGKRQKIQKRPATHRQPKSASGGGGGGKKKDCCPMVAAVRSVKRGKFRLARRYAAMSVGLILARIGRVA